MEEKGGTERQLIVPGLCSICARLDKGKSGMHVQKYSNQEIVRPSTWMWIHFTLRLASTGMKWSGIGTEEKL
jgi:hypothetical protein